MADEKQIEQSSGVIKQLIQEGKIVKPKLNTNGFFLKKSRNALTISERLLNLFEEEQLDTHTWVVNTSYYSMFFAATALLAKHNHKININQGIHTLTYHALIHYFIKEDSKLKWRLMEDYKDAVGEAEELLQLTEQKLKGLVMDLKLESIKRKIFTYEAGEEAERNKALTSYQRAKHFFQEVERMMEK